MNPFSLLIKPAGADCNLRCSYCFYLGRKALYPDQRAPRMREETLTRLVRGYLALPLAEHNFAFQGGEPLLMGIDFFRKLFQLQRRYARSGSRVINSVQTNCTLMTDELAELFARERVLVGVSVDGPEAVHNVHRVDVAGQGSHAAVLRGVERLRAHGVSYNILTLVSQNNVHDPAGLYRYLRDSLGTRYLQFIECVELDDRGQRSAESLTAKDWAAFVIGLFNAWYPQDRHTVSIRLFDSIVSKLVTGRANHCTMGCACRDYVVVEHSGDVYPCDFFVRPELRLGNVLEHDWDEILANPIRDTFARRKAQVDPACRACSYFDFCAGDCPKNRTGHNPALSPQTRSSLCAGWQRIYEHILPSLRAEASAISGTAARS